MQRKLDFKPCVVWVGGDAFVQIVDVRLTGIATDITLEIKAINKLNKTLVKIDYEVIFYDSSETKLDESSYAVDGEAIEIKGSRIGIASRLNITRSYPSARRAEVKLLRAYFDDGNTIDLEYENMEKFAISELKSDEDLELLKKVAGDDSICLSAKLALNWRCVCGYFNGDESVFCNNCMRDKNQVLTDYRSIQDIREKIEREIQGQVDILESSSEKVDVVEEKQETIVEKEEKEELDIKKELIVFLKQVSKLKLILLLSSSMLITSSVILIIKRLLVK